MGTSRLSELLKIRKAALNGLSFCRGIPPGIHQEDVVRSLKIQTFTSSLQGDEKHLERWLGLEGHHDVVPLSISFNFFKPFKVF